MHAVILEKSDYHFRQCPVPVPTPGEVLIKVAYAGINRADLFQKQGRYPLPQNTPAIPGLEVSGEIVECGAEVQDFKPGEKVCALLTEGGYAQYVCAPASILLPVPEKISLQEAASLPEACFTAWISLVEQANLQHSETILIHGGAGGLGSIAIQIANHLGARVFATAGTEEKCSLCGALGAKRAIHYTQEDFVSVMKEAGGADVIFDIVGGDYFERNLACLKNGGRLCIIAFLHGSKISTNLSPVLLKQLSIFGSTLRSKPLAYKATIASKLRAGVWKAVENGTIKPVIDQIFSLSEAQKALTRMDQGLNLGKILLKM